MTPADRLKKVRKDLKLTQEKLAFSIGLKREHITNLESGKVKISTLHALAFEYVHGVNKDWLLNERGDCFHKKSEKEIISSSTKAIIQLEFNDPEKGLLNYKRLIEVEKISQKVYDKITEDIKQAHEIVMLIQEEKKEKHIKKSNYKTSEKKIIKTQKT